MDTKNSVRIEKTVPAGTKIIINGIPLELKNHTEVKTTEENFHLAFEETPRIPPWTAEETREYYIKIRESSINMLNTPDIDLIWQIAYQNLASAADHINAMIARTIIEEVTP